MIRGIFFFKQKTAYEMRISDWSSDVCSSDLPAPLAIAARCDPRRGEKPGEPEAATDRDELPPVLRLGSVAADHRRVLVPEQAVVGDQLRTGVLDHGLRLPVHAGADGRRGGQVDQRRKDRKSTRLNSSH